MIHFEEIFIKKSTSLGGGSKELVVHAKTDTDTFEFIMFQPAEGAEWLLDELAYIYYKNDESNALQIFIQPNQFKEYQAYLVNHPIVHSS
ncbi:hypothetical protein [Bacillus suaedaesalsae]|uniref:Uncharacterized protein n=1 Tax=Bacillus suaedaesalsae TaxID=2810349 RepID=A0ABS2DG82_9BACI|nr:hypothetical protein [Bacillus suaedaesalsae]MBM6617463.1 hypothetical protein [Bacillus suaedaesalsae]